MSTAEIAAEELHFRRSKVDSSWWKNSTVHIRRSFSSSAKEISSTGASKMDQAGFFTLPAWHQQGSHHKDQQQQQQQLQPSASSVTNFHLPWKYASATKERKSFELPKPPVLQEQQHQLPIPPPPFTGVRSSSKVVEFFSTRKQIRVKDTATLTAESAPTLSSLDVDVKHVNEASLILSEVSLNHSLARALPCPPEERSAVTGSSQQETAVAAAAEAKSITTNGTKCLESTIQNGNIFSGNTMHKLPPIRLQKSSSTSSDHQQSHKKLANSLLFDSQYSSCDAASLSKNHVLVGGSMRVERDFYDAESEFITSPTAPRTSLPTTPRRRAESHTSFWLLRRLRLGGGGGKGSSAAASHREESQVGFNSKTGKQDRTTPVVVAAAAAAPLRHGKKKNCKASKAAAHCVPTDPTIVDVVHHQHEDDDGSIKIAEGNHEEHHHSFRIHLGQYSRSDSTKDFVAKPEQKKLNRWPFSKWKWSSRSQSKVVSEQEEEEAEEEDPNTRLSIEDASSSQQTMYNNNNNDNNTSKSSPHQRFVRFSKTPQEVKESSAAAATCHASNDSEQEQEPEEENGNNNNMVEEEVFVDCKSGFESKLVKQRKMGSFSSMESMELESELEMPPLLVGEQSLTIEEVLALSSSPLKFKFKCREIQHFNKFLRLQKKRLTSSLQRQQQHPENTDCFHIIRSGTQCEVSSMVSALLMVWLMENISSPCANAAENWHLIPVANIARQQMHNHKDAAWLFDACGVDAHALVFADEVEWEKLTKAGRIKIQDIGQDLMVATNEVGSVCTLLGERLQKEANCLLQLRYVKTLLLAGILLDTKNLQAASRRDIDMATALLVGSGSLGRNGFYKQLRDIESEEKVSKLVTQIYGDASQLSRQPRGEELEPPADHEHSEKDSYFLSVDGHCSREQTLTSEAGTRSSEEEDSPQLQTAHPIATTFLPTKIIGAPLSVPARFQLPSPSGVRSTDADAADKTQIRQTPGANRSLLLGRLSFGSSSSTASASASSRHLKSGSNSFSMIHKTMLYSA